MSRLALATLGFLGAALLSGCGESHSPTQVIVVVDADLTMRAQTDVLQITALGGTGRGDTEREVRHDESFAIGEGEVEWPFHVAVVPLAGDDTRILEVIAEAFDGSTAIGRVRVITGFVPGQTRYVPLTFVAGCRGMLCPAGRTCHTRDCETAQVDVDDLAVEAPQSAVAISGPGVDAGTDAGGGRDADGGGARDADGGGDAGGGPTVMPGTRDASIDACASVGEVCNGNDDDCDGAIDEDTDTYCEGVVRNAVTTCERVGPDSFCLNRSCLPGFFNCDGLYENGCEPYCDCHPCTDAGPPLTMEQQACIDSFASDECDTCSCTRCTQLMLDCYASGDPSADALCTDLVACAHQAGCTGQPCYCGTADVLLCGVSGADGPCIAEVEAAAGTTDPLMISLLQSDPNSVLGRASLLGNCEVANCQEVCP